MPTREKAPAATFRLSPLTENGLVVAAVIAVIVGLVGGARFVRRVCPPCDPETLGRLDRRTARWHSRLLGPLSSVLDFVAIVAPAVVMARDRGVTAELAEDLAVYAEAFAVTSVLNITVKTVIQRPIPLLYTAGLDPVLERSAAGYRSFYSGHTAHMTTALTANAVMSHLRGRHRLWPWLLLPLGTAAMAFARVGAGRHFLKDVAVGAMAGGVSGSLVPLLHPAHVLEPAAPQNPGP